ncbi:MAG: ATP-binding protein [Patescibacteria group bacterium]
MPNETRINLKHLLEDIRDSYSSPIEEVIITELVANALDSGASRLDFITDPENLSLTCIDNGRGMTRAQFREYHNIASSSKTRGQGIGFAGVGAKLSLLIARSVVTETNGPRGGRCASEWKLASPSKAPWKFIPSTGKVAHPRGTSVAVFLNSSEVKVFGEKFIENSIVKHFYSLLNNEMYEKILRQIYKSGVEFLVNGQRVVLPEDIKRHEDKWFEVRLKKQSKLIGYGFLAIKDIEGSWLDKISGGKPAPLSLSSGLTISTYGKVIKSGWEWVGLSPKSHQQLVGVVEVPALSEILTTNKDNFLSDSASLNKYYRYRKAIQEAVLPILKIFGGEKQPENNQREDYMKPLTRQIDGALGILARDFPELTAIIGAHRARVNASEAANSDERENALAKLKLGKTNLSPEKPMSDVKESKPNLQPDEQGEHQKQLKKPGLKIVLESFAEGPSLLGRIIEDTAYINSGHPAWARAVGAHSEEYHVVVTIALLLFDFVQSGQNPHEFVSKFLTELSEQQKPRTLL